MDVVRLTAADFDEAMDFMNMVFSMSGGATDFQRFLPKLYQPDDRLMRAHFAIRRAGRIRAVIGQYPMAMQIGGVQVTVSGIGGVCTHPGEQKSGLMRHLMAAVLADMEHEHYAFSVLGGQRQRYGYFGYEKSGASLVFSLSKTNLRHFFRNQTPQEIGFTRINPENQSFDTHPAGQLQEWQILMKTWFDRQPIHVVRGETDFLTILSSRYARIWLAQTPEGRPVGYLLADRDGTTVREIITESAEFLLPAAAAWVERQSSDSVLFYMPPWRPDAIAEIGKICEHASLEAANSYRINDWPLVLSALLQVKGSQICLPDGVVRLGIHDQDRSSVFSLSWRDGRAFCLETPAAQADLSFDRLTATRFLFGPLPPFWAAPHYAQVSSALTNLCSAWFPLPLCWPAPDCV